MNLGHARREVTNSSMNFAPEPRRLDALINPSSVVVIGASSKVGHFANQPIVNLRTFGYKGSVYLVNPNHNQIDGEACFPDVSSVPETPELAIIVVPPNAAVDALAECAALGVQAAVIVGSGFAESGLPDRIALQARIAEIVRTTGIRVCGPNTLGIANWSDGIVSFASGNIPPSPKTGPVAVVSQSGGLGFTIINRAWSRDVGIGHLAVAGNEVDVSIPELAEHYLRRDDVQTVACYMESLRDIEGLRRLGETSAALGKPVFVLKAGRSVRGEMAAAAHTGALAASDEVCSAAFKQWGLIRVTTLDGLVNAASLAANAPAPRDGGVGVYCQGGGIAVLTSDLFEAHDVDLPQLSESTSAALLTILPDSSAANPLDSGGQFLSKGPAPLVEALGVFEADTRIGVLAIMAMPVLGARAETYTTAIEEAAVARAKPFVVIPYGAGELTAESFRRFRAAGLPVLEPPSGAVEGLSAWLLSARPNRSAALRSHDHVDAGRATESRALIAQWRNAGHTTIPEYEAAPLFQLYDIALPRQRVVKSASDAISAAQELGDLVAMKVASPDIPHRSDVGGIALNVPADQVGGEFSEMLERVKKNSPTAHVVGVSIVEMIDPGVEVIVGMNRDPLFGPVLVVGMGGVFAEVLSDVAIRVLPIDRFEISSMFEELKGVAVLQGSRGQGAVEFEALIDVVERFGELIFEVGDEFSAVDLNPVLTYPSGKSPVAADALIQLTEH